jgi:flagellar export protein FliJ
MKARAAWPLLAQKAEDAVNAIRVELVASRKRIEHLQVSRARMQNLYEDYKRRATQAQEKLHTMVETTSYRHYMLQLQELVQRVDKDLQVAFHDQQQIKDKLLKAEQHLMRMQSLVERDLDALRKHNRVQDQKQMDALGLTLFNLRS